MAFQGFISTRKAPINPLARSLVSAIPSWVNLVAIAFAPAQASEGLFIEPLRLLQSLPKLRTLRVNATCTDTLSSPILSQIVGLRTLTLIDPSRAILDLLPDWLSRLSGTLHGLHLLVSIFIYWLTPKVTLSLEGKLRFHHPGSSPNNSASGNATAIIFARAILFSRRRARPSLPFAPPSPPKSPTSVLLGKLEAEFHQPFSNHS